MNRPLYVTRSSLSRYFQDDFCQKERKLLCQIPGIRFVPFEEMTPSSDPLVIVTNTHVSSEQLSPYLSQTQLIIHPQSGYDCFHPDDLKREGVEVVLGNPLRADAVTQAYLSAYFAHKATLPLCSHWDQERSWRRKLIQDQNILIVGYGHIGQKLAQALLSMGARPRIYDPYQGHSGLETEGVDVVFMACSLNRDNRFMIDKSFLLSLSDDFLFMNMARGELVDEESLVEVLNQRPKARAVLDVFSKEPHSFETFSNSPGLFKMSHVAGVYDQLSERTLQFEYDVLNDFVSLGSYEFRVKYSSLLLSKRDHPGNLTKAR